ncbi:GerAB/ArcD/ProY family transporter [Desulfofundulus thermobenzoicus]|uniref:GerAB/ArcD/ProY family transporter n=1 Tax=Desulfofundulus thermobenzoicus TaxID=29376 RepID=A0A6N7IM48_9FIRM|nr:endospore germination permease [Desulfofundulus thermobenzoicus]MQL51021.1 GerAB/ArcD/ProY family transporter [Desulfofundulus thermobenzoicus]
MHERGKISGLQIVFLLINLVGATAMVYLPGITATEAGRDSWMVALLATLPGIYVILVVTALGKRFPNQTMIQYMETLLGPLAGKLLALIYILFFLHINGVIVREFGELVATAIMPTTPQVAFAVVLVMVCTYGVYQGLEVIARVMELIYPTILILFGLVLLLVSGHMDPGNLLPVMENGIKPVLRGSLDPIAWRGEVFTLAMLMPYLARPEIARRNGIIAIIAIGFILVVDAMTSTAVFGVSTGRLNYATFEIVRLAGFGQFLTRLDAIWIAIWVLSIFGKVGLFHFATVIGTAQLLRLKDHRVVLIPSSILLITMSLSQFDNVTEMVEFIVGAFIPYAYVIEIIIPTFLLILAWLKGKTRARW